MEEGEIAALSNGIVRLILTSPDVPTQWRRGSKETSIAVGLAGTVRVKLWVDPAVSHSNGRIGAPLAPVTWTTAAAPPSPGSIPGEAGDRVRPLAMLAVIMGIPATSSVIPVLVPGIVIGESDPIGAVNDTGDEEPDKGSAAGQLVHPSKFNVRVPEIE